MAGITLTANPRKSKKATRSLENSRVAGTLGKISLDDVGPTTHSLKITCHESRTKASEGSKKSNACASIHQQSKREAKIKRDEDQGGWTN